MVLFKEDSLDAKKKVDGVQSFMPFPVKGPIEIKLKWDRKSKETKSGDALTKCLKSCCCTVNVNTLCIMLLFFFFKEIYVQQKR